MGANTDPALDLLTGWNVPCQFIALARQQLREGNAGGRLSTVSEIEMHTDNVVISVCDMH